MISKNPTMKRHSCKEAWNNLDKAKSVKEQRCTEFDDCKRKADFEFERQEQDYKELQSSAGVKRKKSKLIYELRAHNDHNSLDVDQEDQSTETDKETLLVEVHLSVETSNRSANVPFVCLTSKLIGKTIIGYPIQIEVLSDGSSETVPRAKESVAPKLVWRTSKRTPVCYLQTVKASENYEGSILRERENGVGMKEKPLVKLMKNPKKFNGGDAARRRTCVSVELVFSKIFAAIG